MLRLCHPARLDMLDGEAAKLDVEDARIKTMLKRFEMWKEEQNCQLAS